ncbi:hypothetical protein YC2023_022829 [Brassica napus]|uniref:(rape) hypothetical protein n=1 Tax=Brassica napus TaxID=3708 RepID=A0A816WV28_BRANA|nr:unnamed protein product [Brassica napus]
MCLCPTIVNAYPPHQSAAEPCLPSRLACLCPTVVDASPPDQSTVVSMSSLLAAITCASSDCGAQSEAKSKRIESSRTTLVSDCFVYIGLDRVMRFEHD